MRRFRNLEGPAVGTKGYRADRLAIAHSAARSRADQAMKTATNCAANAMVKPLRIPTIMLVLSGRCR